MDRQLEYVLFLAERSIEDAKNLAYIQECLAIAEGGNLVEKITAINEGVVDKAKLAWKKVQDWIKNVWAKFTEKFNKLAMDDANYLKEYSEIILKRQPVDATYTMLDYPTAIYRCTQIKVPVLNYKAMEKDLEDGRTFLKTIIRDYDGRTEPADFIKTYFKGGSDDPQSIHVSKLKFADMYDFCVDYKKIHTIIENDKKVIESSFNEAEKAINALKDTVAPAPDKADNKPAAGATTTDNKDDQKEVKESFMNKFFGQDKSVYSNVYGIYITEADGDRQVTNKDDGNKATATPQAQAGQKASDNMRSVTGNDDGKSIEQRNKDTQDAVGEGDINKAIDKINVYNTIATSIMSAKLTAVEGAQKTYMKILRTHIKDHVGNKDSQTGANSSRTDYRTPYEKSSEAKRKEIDEWAKKNIGMTINDLIGKINSGEAIDGATLNTVNNRAADIIKYIGQANFDKISTASTK